MNATETKLYNEAMQELIRNANECIFYVAASNHIRNRLSTAHNVTSATVGNIIAMAACDLSDAIKTLKLSKEIS